MFRATVATSFVCAALTAQAVVGVEQPRGGWAALPMCIALPGNQGVLRRKASGDQTTTPQPFAAPVPTTGPAIPNFTASAMFGAQASIVEVDAVSIGNDRVPLTTSLVLNPSPPPDTGWANILFSVTRATRPLDGGVIASRANQNNGAGADIFSLYAPGSATSPADDGIPAPIVDVIFFEQGFEHIGLLTTDEIMALDPYIPLVAAGENQSTLPELLYANSIDLGTNIVRCTFYFSVTRASATLINTQAPTWVAGLPNRGVSAADILKIEWTASGWTSPSVHLTADTIGLTLTDNLTSLAVDTLHGHVIYTPEINGGNLYAYKPTASPTSGTVKRIDGPPIRLVQSGDVDAIGAYDPETAQFQHVHGVPIAMQTVMPRFGISVARDLLSQGYNVVMSGWPVPRTNGTLRLLRSANGTAWIQIGSPIPRTPQMFSVSSYYPNSMLRVQGQIWLRAEFTPSGSSMPSSTWAVKLEQ